MVEYLHDGDGFVARNQLYGDKARLYIEALSILLSDATNKITQKNGYELADDT